MARLLPLAHFGGRAALSRSWGYFAAHLRTLIWGLSFIKCFFSIFSPENASQISFSISEETAPPTDPGQQPPKRASANERPLTQGGRGPFPATLCVRAFSRESLDPRPGPGGKPPRRCQPAPVQTRTTYQGQPGAAYPLGGCLRSHLGAQRPGGPACPARVPISPEKWGERGPGAVPPGPPVLWPACCRSLVLAFVPHCPGRGAISLPIFVP